MVEHNSKLCSIYNALHSIIQLAVINHFLVNKKKKKKSNIAFFFFGFVISGYLKFWGQFGTSASSALDPLEW